MTQVIILNSGVGSRMGELTADKPKCLVEIDEHDNILTRQIKTLLEYGLDEIIITTGPFEDKIKRCLKGSLKAVKLDYVNNPLYDSTNYIYSLLLTADKVEDDIILMHGDLVYDPVVLGRLLVAPHSDAVLINPYVDLPEKDFKARLQKGLVKEIAVDIFGQDCAFLIPIYKLSRGFFESWLKEMEKFRQADQLKVYAENALNNLLDELALNTVDLEDEFCMEIDDLADLEKARLYLSNENRGDDN